jgi:hypothetical protein
VEIFTGAGIGEMHILSLLRGGINRAPVWALVVTLSWTSGCLTTHAAGIDLAQQWAVFGSSGALLFQLLAGLTLAWLLPGRKAMPAAPARRAPCIDVPTPAS